MKRLLSARSLLLTGACLAWLSPAFAQEDSSPSDSTPAVEQEEEARQETVVVRGLFIPDEKRSTSEVAAFGDGNNDTAMFQVAVRAEKENEGRSVARDMKKNSAKRCTIFQS